MAAGQPLTPQQQQLQAMIASFSPGGSRAGIPGADSLRQQFQEQLDASVATQNGMPDQATQYGGSPEAQQSELARMGGLAGGYETGFGNSMADRMAARGSQNNALDLMRNAAEGNAPSVAEIQQREGLNAAMRNQQALAGGARGAAGLAGAQYGAAQNTAMMQQQGIGQASALRAGEMANARGAYGQMGLGMGAQDLSAAGLYGQQAMGFENLGQNARFHSMDATQRYLEMLGNQRAQTAAQEAANRNAAYGVVKDVVGGAAGLATYGALKNGAGGAPGAPVPAPGQVGSGQLTNGQGTDLGNGLKGYY